MARRCLVLVRTTSYQTDAFLAAAARLGVEVVIGSDRCHQLADVWPDEAFAALAHVAGALALDFRHPEEAAAQILDAARSGPSFDAVVATDDHTALIAAHANRALGLPGNDPDAADAARDKSRLRERLRRAGVASPRHTVVAEDAPTVGVLRAVRDAGFDFPVVAKPLLLSASRGVIRADDEPALAAALARIRALLRTRPEHADGHPSARRVLVEEFIPGVEVALEGILSQDGDAAPRLRTLALFDKPDPLDGPFFEETIYVTPSRLPDAVQRAIAATAEAAARALGLREGPIHAELRLDERGAQGGVDGGSPRPVVIEVAARSIGGLCARTLRFALGGEADHALEELVLRQALRVDTAPITSLTSLSSMTGAAGVMMLPIPHAGVLQSVAGVDDARAVPWIEDVVITQRAGERLVPLPEGGSYLGFVFARAGTPADVERALRAAHARLRFHIAPSL